MIRFLAITALLVAGLFAAFHAGAPLWAVALYGSASAACFVLFAVDKSAAIRRRWRVPEHILIFLCLIGGWPGAFLGQYMLRHKSKKASFRFAAFGSAVANVLAFYLLHASVSSLIGQ